MERRGAELRGEGCDGSVGERGGESREREVRIG